MKSPHHFILLCCLSVALAESVSGQDIEVSPHRKPHTQDSTVGYEMTAVEMKHQEGLKPDMGKQVGFGTKEADSLVGKTGKVVAWFGIVREIKPLGKGAELLVEHKYFDGLNDGHMQLASIFGAGDFRARLAATHPDLGKHCLVRIIGKVTEQKDKLPMVEAIYVRVWRKGDFAFMDYGKDASNERWVKLRQKTGPGVYSSEPDEDYYKALLGD
jgi:hypothetical protein